ncbi:UDP-N-acetylmuramate--L-alanine ligase [Sandaracinobacter sp. RS1-74]|uniref:UDP-N-acetylmuramate--L-alanine ligase n=1 Tax=Sandaracinobacteroides sayramensis TaxID=2913411 RepID=UPI001EDC69FA|nr:UDP-N-acetylmuramate--L-alanine ligase [Sandaracinobacteroides sayramensis]MCG2840474.1 UDP-N-acetylmuramate--L-alanine ligase [Sandaracinobacteroides sayramensis]
MTVFAKAGGGAAFNNKVGPIHFIGIGGIGMSGIAEVMANLGFEVQGSDIAEGYVVQGLRAKGITVHIGHKAENLGDAAVVVVSTAIRKGNPEVDLALERRIPVVRRAEMLAELMRLKSTVCVAGTHGKTTTTSMVAALLDAGGLDPTVINGGIINSYGSNARLGDGDWMVVEADESDGSFLRLPPTLAVVTNIDPEHLDHYGDFEVAKAAFRTFIQKVPFYGAAVLCLDHPEVQAMIPSVSDRRIVTYGFAGQADIRGDRVEPIPGGNRFDVTLRTFGTEERRYEGLVLPMPGRHNVLNALAAIGIADQLGIPEAKIREGFARFGGVKRRFTKVGELPLGDGEPVTIIDDYGHHPVEVKAVLAAAREGARSKVVAVVQPHRYTRLRDLFDEWRTAFNDADTVVLAPVYAAGEPPIEGVTHEALADALRRSGHRQVLTISGEADLAPTIAPLLGEGDMAICLGAGDITKWAANLAAGLQAAGVK